MSQQAWRPAAEDGPAGERVFSGPWHDVPWAARRYARLADDWRKRLMARCILHFGMHKTGSSSIQQSLWSGLRDDRYRYISLGGANQSGKMVTLFEKSAAKYHAHVKRGMTTGQIDRLRVELSALLDHELRQARGRVAIISAESMSLMTEAGLARCRAHLLKHGYEASAVGYIRAPKSYLESAYQQRLKGGGGRFSFASKMPRYRRSFAKFDKVLGRDNVQFWKFEPAEFPGNDVVADFGGRLGISLAAGVAVHRNASLSLPAMQLLYTYRKYGPGYGVGPGVIRENNLLIARLGQLPGRKFRLHSSLVAPLIHESEDDLRWMESRMGDSLREDIAGDDEAAVRSEDDLLNCDPAAIEWLSGQLEPDIASLGPKPVAPRQVADWVHHLRNMLAAGPRRRGVRPSRNQNSFAEGAGPGADDARTVDVQIDIDGLVLGIIRKTPRLAGIAPDLACALLDGVLREIARIVDDDRNARLELPDFGNFRSRTVAVAGARNAVVKTARRTFFQPAPEVRDGNPASARRGDGSVRS